MRLSPVQVDSNTWTAVSAGSYHTLAIKSDGTLWAWGTNDSGQLGIGNTAPSLVPSLVDNGFWLNIAAGESHSLGIKNSNTLWAWGDHTYGQLGLGTINPNNLPQLIPAQVGTESDWERISAGQYFSVGIRVDGFSSGTLLAWGDNGAYQLGTDPDTEPDRNVPSPVNPAGLTLNWVNAECGFAHVIAVSNDGGTMSLWTWGLNNWGQLGDGTVISKILQYPIDSSHAWSPWLLSAGGYHTMAARDDATTSLWTWGLNDSGQLGTRTTDNELYPANM